MNTRIACRFRSYTILIIRIGKDIRRCTRFFQLITYRFIHIIIKEKRSTKPPKYRGGIFTDDIGIRKLLILIILIIYTLNAARSLERR